ncbi:MAG: replication-associated recombination protein A [Alphaproteobacteria bacterium]
MTNLFQAAGLEKAAPRPLADQLRPTALEEVVGQEHLLARQGPLGRMLAEGRLASLVFWGPPGCGKTTIARLLASRTNLHFEPLSAVFSGVADLRRVFDAARRRRETGRGTLLFVDEIHRFNRAQQDGFLPYVEDGTVVLVGATTENPSFELNAALLSRCQVLVLNRLGDAALEELLRRAETAIGHPLPLQPDARGALKALADGDGRYLLNLVEELARLRGEPLDTAQLAAAVQRRAPLYDKSQEGHYNLISALHKSMRGSDPDAALYWFARMLDGGEDPRYVARRLVRFAVEDVGMADPSALPHAVAGWETYERLGSPEGELALAQVVVQLATAPKSNAVYRAYGAARSAAKETGSLMPPKHILNAPTRLMKDLGYAAGYAYDHDAEGAFSGQNYFPDGMPRRRFYRPTPRGHEAEIGRRVRHWDEVRARKAGTAEEPHE